MASVCGKIVIIDFSLESERQAFDKREQNKSNELRKYYNELLISCSAAQRELYILPILYNTWNHFFKIINHLPSLLPLPEILLLLKVQHHRPK